MGRALSFAEAKRACACELATRRSFSHAREPDCDYDPTIDDKAAAALQITTRVAPDTVRPGRDAALMLRYVNTSDEPVHLLLDRDDHPEDSFPTIVDAKGAEVKSDHDRSCTEIATVGMAEFALVVIEPGGALESPIHWRANRTRRVGEPGGMGCRSAPGKELAPGKYSLRFTTNRVWPLRDTKLETAVEVR